MIVTTVFCWTIDDIRRIINCVCDPFIWSYTSITYMWDTVLKFLWNNLQAAVIYMWQDIVLFFTIMWFIFKLAVLAVFSGLTIYLPVIIYRFFSRRDFALQCEYYFGPTLPPGRNQGQGVLTIAPVMLDPQGQGHAWVVTPSLAAAAVMPTITVAHYYYIVEPGCPHRRVKSVVTCTSKDEHRRSQPWYYPRSPRSQLVIKECKVDQNCK